MDIKRCSAIFARSLAACSLLGLWLACVAGCSRSSSSEAQHGTGGNGSGGVIGTGGSVGTGGLVGAGGTGGGGIAAGTHENSATHAPSDEGTCSGRWQSVNTKIPGSFSLRLSTTKDGQGRLNWPNPTREAMFLAAYRAKGPANRQGMIEICSQGPGITNSGDSVSLRDLQDPLKLNAGYYLVNVQSVLGLPAKVSNPVTIHIK